MLRTDQGTSAGETKPAGARGAFSIAQLITSPLLSNEENRRRTLVVREYFAWDSVSALEKDFAATVGPYYKYISHHARQAASDVILFLSGDSTARKTMHIHSDAPSLTPLDVFSLPFRHLKLSEPIAVLGFEYGLTYVPHKHAR